jgi:hypothetical protein
MHGPTRDAVWTGLTQRGAAAHVPFWTDLLRRAPADLLSGVAGVAAFVAFQSGQGALAWCVLDRCDPAAEGGGLARLVRELLECGAPPLEWEEGRPTWSAGTGSLPLASGT